VHHIVPTAWYIHVRIQTKKETVGWLFVCLFAGEAKWKEGAKQKRINEQRRNGQPPSPMQTNLKRRWVLGKGKDRNSEEEKERERERDS
jgi:hypothetical protein